MLGLHFRFVISQEISELFQEFKFLIHNHLPYNL